MRISLIIILLVFAGCKQEKKPMGVLSEDEMVRILIDISLAEARLNNIPINKDSANQLYIPFEREFLKKKSLSDSALLYSYDYYLNHPADLERIYDIVIDSLNLREQHLIRQTRMSHP